MFTVVHPDPRDYWLVPGAAQPGTAMFATEAEAVAYCEARNAGSSHSEACAVAHALVTPAPETADDTLKSGRLDLGRPGGGTVTTQERQRTMETYHITTDNRQRDMVTYNELPVAARGLFDYVRDDLDSNDKGQTDTEPRFFRAYGVWFDYYEIERAPHGLARQGWDGYTNIAIGACYVFRYFDRDGYPLDGPVVGFATYAV